MKVFKYAGTETGDARVGRRSCVEAGQKMTTGEAVN